jgi:hypothetical protein
VDVHVKFLLVVPLLLAAELFMHKRMRHIERQFIGRNLIPENEIPRFENIISSSYRLRNSKTIEILLLAVVYVLGVTILWRNFTSLQTATWYSSSAAEGSKLLPAGFWYGYVSIPIFQFLLLRWYFRLYIWMRFIWKVSRIDLKLIQMHPDRMGGIGFLSGACFGFIPLAMAHGALLAGQIANKTFNAGASLPDFSIEIFTVLIFLLIMTIGPLIVLTPKLDRARRTGRREFSEFAMKYVRSFDSKWLRGGAPKDEQLLGTGDIQSLADLANSYAVVSSMHYLPITKEAVLQIAISLIIPILPLFLTMMPLGEILKKVVGIIL